MVNNSYQKGSPTLYVGIGRGRCEELKSEDAVGAPLTKTMAHAQQPNILKVREPTTQTANANN
jgi:hypothetical protein